MLHGGKRRVEMMQQRTPFLVLGGSPETLGVVFQPRPFHQQQVRGWVLDAAGQHEALEAGHGANDGFRFAKSSLEVFLQAGPDGEQCMFGNHPTIMPEASPDGA
jgi:hypothetical protein